jgi:AcrR family transcriptional regulator
MAAAERRTQAERRAEAEERILAAAIRLVGEKGLGALTLADAGAAAGYSRALPAHYFGSRDGLVAALVDRVMRQFVARAQPRDTGLPPLVALRRTMDYYVENVVAERAGWRVFLELLHEALINPAVAGPRHRRAGDLDPGRRGGRRDSRRS